MCETTAMSLQQTPFKHKHNVENPTTDTDSDTDSETD